MVSRSQAGFGVVDWILLVAVIAVGAAILIPYTISEKQDKSMETCVRNLRELDKAMRLWQLDNAKGPTAPVTMGEILPYLKAGASTNCPSHGQYVVTGLTNPPSCTFPGHVLSN